MQRGPILVRYLIECLNPKIEPVLLEVDGQQNREAYIDYVM
jgi:hypothetical protein